MHRTQSDYWAIPTLRSALAASACWSDLLAGVPSISTTIVDNQSVFVSGGVRLGATVEPRFDLNDIAAWRKLIGEMISDGSQRVQLAARGRSIVDGKGLIIAEALLDYKTPPVKPPLYVIE